MCFQFDGVGWPQSCVAFFQGVPIRLKALRRKPYDFEPLTIGDHIHKRRLERRMLQRELAEELDVDATTIVNWEKGHWQPVSAVHLYRVIRFLGHDPLIRDTTLPSLLKAKRRALGLTLKAFAAELGVDPDTASRWEREGTIQVHRHRAIVAKILGIPEDSIPLPAIRKWGGRTLSNGEMLT